MTEIWARRRQALLEAELGREIVGLSVDQGTCFGFNETAAAVWKRLEQPTRKQDLVSDLLDRFDIDAATCAAEVDGLLDRLVDLELVELEERPA